MLGYDHWGNHSSSSPPHHPQLMLSDVVDNLQNHQHHHRQHDNNNNNNNNNNPNYGHIGSQSTYQNNRPMFDEHFTNPYTFPHDNTITNNNNNNHSYYQNLLFNDPRAFQAASYPNPNPTPTPCLFSLDHLSGPTGFTPMIPKTEPDPYNMPPIGLDLGRRTYFSPDDDLVSRLYRRSRPADVAINTPKCQAEGCNADLSNAKHYHRRHKVCEFHSKAATVIAAGLIQRFCQQCSRFHLLGEFDNGKRSCRKRLADHNRRRRKSNQVANHENRMASPMSSDNTRTSPSQSN